MPQYIKAAIFDLDGTLANTIGDLHTSMNQMLSELSYPLIDEKILLSSINNGAKEFVRGCVPAEVANNEEKLCEALAVYQKAYRIHYLEKTYFYPGMNEALKKLKESGIKLAVLSNKNDEMVKKIVSKLQDGDYFDLMWGYLELPHKPDPSSALCIAKKLGVDPSETAFIGDSDIDIKTAVNAGMIPIGVTWGYRDKEILAQNGAKYFIESPEKLSVLTKITL